jgi:hypothetical protein
MSQFTVSSVLDLRSSCEQFEVIASELLKHVECGSEHGAVEEYLRVAGFELLRRAYQSYLDHRAECEEKHPSVKGSDGEIRSHRRSGSSRTLESIFGEVIVRRICYSTKERGCDGIYLGDGQLNLAADKFSDGLHRLAAEEASKVSFEEASQLIGKTTAGTVAKRQVEEIVVKVSADFDSFYAQRSIDCSDEGDSLLVMTTDSKGIVMNEEDLRPATAKSAKESQHKCQTRLSKGEKRNRKRMATVASVYGVGRWVRTPEDILGEKNVPLERPKVVNKRVWASVERSQEEVISDMFDEAQRRDPKQQRAAVILVDGHVHQLKLIHAELKRRQLEATVIVDFIHVLEYLWKAAFAFHKPGTIQAEEWVQERAHHILAGNASGVAAGMRRSATLQGLATKDRQPVDTCANYILSLSDYLRYDQYLTRGFPIATGVIEGACRHLIADRMDITGARWRLARAEAVLKIRALRASGDFEKYWTFHKAQELIRNHSSKLHDPEMLLAA